MDPRVELVEKAMQLVGGRWKPAIMFCLNTIGTHRFSELERMIPGVSQRMLTKQLRDLERHGLIELVEGLVASLHLVVERDHDVEESDQPCRRLRTFRLRPTPARNTRSATSTGARM